MRCGDALLGEEAELARDPEEHRHAPDGNEVTRRPYPQRDVARATLAEVEADLGRRVAAADDQD